MDLLVIIGLAVFWYGIVPIVGALIANQGWRRFRRRFDDLRIKPLLNYAAMTKAEGPAEYRFTGNFESVSENHILWVRNSGLTVPVNLEGARTFLLPNTSESGIPAAFDPGEEIPVRFRWNSLSTLTGDTKVFVGGTLALEGRRPIFVSSPDKPLLVIFYEGADHSLTLRTIRAGRGRGTYFNFITPYALILGAFCQIFIALSYFTRPAMRSMMILAMAAIFTPLFPMLPPGFVFTFIAQRFQWRARLLQAYRDLARLPLRYFQPGNDKGKLPGGEDYIVRRYENLPPEFYERKIPLIIPAGEKRRGEIWHVFGVLPKGDETLPGRPTDIFAVYGALPGDPSVLVRRYNFIATVFDITALLFIVVSLGINAYLVRLVILFVARV
jgi:hypothetical protein